MNRSWLVLFVGLLSATVAVSLLPSKFVPSAPALSDKAEHAAVYLILFIVGAQVFSGTMRRLILAACLMTLGILLETAQYFVPGRYPELLDALANAAGVGLGAVLVLGLLKWRARVSSSKPEKNSAAQRNPSEQ